MDLLIDSDSYEEFFSQCRVQTASKLRSKILAAIDAKMSSEELDKLIENELEYWSPLLVWDKYV
jgi:hypothetical protein